MKLWLDAQLAPSLAPWLTAIFGVEAIPARDVGLRDATDRDIFFAARAVSAVVLTKDIDFVGLLERHGPPPQVIWLTCGNTSNEHLRALLGMKWPTVADLLRRGEPLVEISG